MKACRFIPLFFFLLLAAQFSGAQFNLGGPTGKMMLVIMPDVQKDLKMTKDQQKQVQAVMQSMNSAGNMQMPTDMSQMNAQMDAPILAVLNADQLARLQELWIQYNGTKVLQDDTVAKGLQLTDDQKTKIKQLWDDYGQSIMDAMQKRSQSAMNSMKKKKKETDEASLALLTPDQLKAFTDMQGKPHKFPQASQY